MSEDKETGERKQKKLRESHKQQNNLIIPEKGDRMRNKTSSGFQMEKEGEQVSP